MEVLARLLPLPLGERDGVRGPFLLLRFMERVRVR
jgi:hypothetical protein